MNVLDKIALKRKQMGLPEQPRKKSGRWSRKERDVFLLWGEYPKGWQMIKDLILCLMLLSALIGHLQQIDLAMLMAPSTITIVNTAAIQPAEASMAVSEVKTPENAKSEASEGIQAIVSKVHRLESSAGKNDSCKDRGKVNGYGYGQNADTWYCYDSQEQVQKIVSDWFERNLQTYTVAEALCGYNLGFKSDHFNECVNQSPEYPYYRNYLNL